MGKIKVLHITYTTSGGAGIAVLRLHRALCEQGVESRILCADTHLQDEAICRVKQSSRGRSHLPNIPIVRSIVRKVHKHGYGLTPLEKLEYELDQLDKQYPAYFDLPLSSYALEQHAWVEWADVIHIHWISGFIDFPTFFSQVHKPIIWTMHDLNPFYGGFHHFRLRDKYAQQYAHLETVALNVKREAMHKATNVSLIAISGEMHRLMAEHPIYADKCIFDIHNCIDPHQFPLMNKAALRDMFGWNSDEKVLLFVNKNMNDTEKGLTELVSAVEQLQNPAIRLVCVGEGNAPVSNCARIQHLHAVNDMLWLAMLYSAADLLVMPTHQEAFPSTPLEAMLCGTPVMMTPVSGAVDMMTDQTGVIADGFTPLAIANGICAALKKSYDRSTLRQHVLSHFAPEIIAQQHIAAYNQILKS